MLNERSIPQKMIAEIREIMINARDIAAKVGNES